MRRMALIAVVIMLVVSNWTYAASNSVSVLITVHVPEAQSLRILPETNCDGFTCAEIVSNAPWVLIVLAQAAENVPLTVTVRSAADKTDVHTYTLTDSDPLHIFGRSGIHQISFSGESVPVTLSLAPNTSS